MANIMDCTFNSVWDGESVVITTNAKIDLDTGRVFDIEEVDAEEVETLDREYIDFAGIDGEFEVEPGDNVDYAVCDLAEVVNAFRTVELESPLKI